MDVSISYWEYKFKSKVVGKLYAVYMVYLPKVAKYSEKKSANMLTYVLYFTCTEKAESNADRKKCTPIRL